MMPALQEQGSMQRRPSLARYEDAQLAWPVNDYTFHRAQGMMSSQGASFLVGDDCPSFPSLVTAHRAFFSGITSMLGTGQLPSDFCRLRVVQSAAWLRQIIVTPTHLDLRIGGEARAGTRVALNGSTYQAGKPVGTTGKVRLRLPSGLPDDVGFPDP
jgi:hypothetical protein